MSKHIEKQRHKYMKRTAIINGLTDKIIVYFNNFKTCNKIDRNIRQKLNDETIRETEMRFRELFPTTTTISDTECNEILNSIWKSKNLCNAPIQEYHWFKRVINLVENLPICITISSARKEYFGFPLVYVNKEFKKTTEYNKSEILGQNCKFLQPIEPIDEEFPQHTLICNSLREAVSTSVIITNIKKSGIPFFNLLSFKPIFDKEGKYIYCMAIQSEIINEDIGETCAQNIIDVLNILSNIDITH